MVTVLPERAILFHIGPQKTGTTTLQRAAAAHRRLLLEHGVRYPGDTVNHRMQVAALVGKPVGWKVDAAGRPTSPPPIRLWERLVADVRSDPVNRVWLSHEYGAGASRAQAERAAADLGDRLQVVVTLRSIARMLPSIWQETNKAAGNRGTFDNWLKKVFDEGSDVHRTIRTRHDQGALLRRWAAAVGPERVTAIVLDPADHTFMFGAFEQLLGLPEGLLTASGEVEDRANRSMTVAEIELMRRFNRGFRGHDTTWSQYDRLVLRGAIARVLQQRTPPAAEPRLAMPEWAADRADAAARRNAEGVATSGVRVLGDPAWLALPAKRRSSLREDHRSVEKVPIDLAVEAMLGLAAAGIGREADFSAPESVDSLASHSGRELVAELSRRVAQRVRKAIPRTERNR